MCIIIFYNFSFIKPRINNTYYYKFTTDKIRRMNNKNNINPMNMSQIKYKIVLFHTLISRNMIIHQIYSKKKDK